jgi:hypothetical protein
LRQEGSHAKNEDVCPTMEAALPLIRRWTFILLAIAWAAPGPLLAQAYPAKPVRMIVAFAPGGPTDLLARVLATGMSKARARPRGLQPTATRCFSLATRR